LATAGSHPALPSLPATLPLETLGEAGFFRIAKAKYGAGEPAFRTSALYRFDDPHQTFGTLYCARDFKTCFLETLIRNHADLRIAKAEFDSRALVFLLLDTSRLKLVPIHGDHATRMRLDHAHLVGENYHYTQALAKLFHDHPDQPHGLIYRSRFDAATLAVVLFVRASALVRKFPGSSHVEFKDAPELCDAVRNTIAYTVV
jgi:RES domain